MSGGRPRINEEECATSFKHRGRKAKNWHLNRSAQGAVHQAVKNGRLERMPCEECWTYPSEAHHEDYAKPLDVIWLCRKHHAVRHARGYVP